MVIVGHALSDFQIAALGCLGILFGGALIACAIVVNDFKRRARANETLNPETGGPPEEAWWRSWGYSSSATSLGYNAFSLGLTGCAFAIAGIGALISVLLL